METLIHFVEALEFWGWIAIIVIGGLTVEGIVKVKRMQIKHAEDVTLFYSYGGTQPILCEQNGSNNRPFLLSCYLMLANGRRK